MKFVFILLLIGATAGLNGKVRAQQMPPRSEDYPVRRSDFYRGRPAAVILDSKRARMYRTILRSAATKGPNFAGHYSLVTWGAGLGTFSMALVDAKTGKVYFPPFREVGDSDYELPKVINPAWRLDSRLFAVRGRLEWQGVEGVYLYTFIDNRFRLVYQTDLAAWNKMRGAMSP